MFEKIIKNKNILMIIFVAFVSFILYHIIYSCSCDNVYNRFSIGK